MRHLDLFSGIGGFALAARWCGMETIGFAEIEPYCSRVLKKHWPDVPNYGDVSSVPTVQADIITGGFPCQPFSLAGKRRGKADDRYLWPAMLEVIARVKPAWVLGENVPGIIKMELDTVLSDLEAEGYEVAPIVIPACAVNALHRRDRVWIIANHEKSPNRNHFGKSNTGQIQQSGNRFKSENVADAESARWRQKGMGKPGRYKESSLSALTPNHDGARSANIQGKRSIAETSRRDESCANDWWDAEPDVGRVVDGIPNRVDRLRALGNAIVPQVACEIMRHIVTIRLSFAPDSETELNPHTPGPS